MARPITYDPSMALERAMDLFWTRGYRDVSVDDVVRDTGLNRHSLYANYGSKLGLLEAALERYIERWQQSVSEALGGPGTPTERIRTLLDLRDPQHDDPFWASMRGRGCLAVKMSGEMRNSHPKIHARVNAAVGWMQDAIQRVIEEGQRNGEFRNERSPEALASVICGGFVAMLFVEPTVAMRDAFASTLV